MKKSAKDKPLVNTAMRLDQTKIKEAHDLGINLGVLFREALDAALLKHKGKCPTCGVRTEIVNKWTRKTDR